MRTGIVVQVRLGSRRLPGKALLELAGATVTHHVLRALREVPAEGYVMATDGRSAGVLRRIADEEGFELFEGPSEDVLARYVMAAQRFGLDQIVRATGDNPLVSPRLACQILEIHLDRDADLSHYLGCPLGTGVEVVRAQALRAAAEQTEDPYEREHLTTHLYRNQGRYLVVEEPCPPECRLAEAEVSVDTPQDYEMIRRLYGELYDGRPIETDRLVRWLGGPR